MAMASSSEWAKPEAGPGPHDARYLFAEFRDLMDATGARSGMGAGSGAGARSGGIS